MTCPRDVLQGSSALPVSLQIIQLISQGALFVVNHSGGKDSQAMLIKLREFGVPDDQLLIIHADLGKVEWAGSQEHIKRTSFGLPLVVAKARRTLLQMVEERGMWPSPQQRQCTSDLKRGPIEREIRRHLKANPHYRGLVVNCMGMRAQESHNRAKAEKFRFNARNSKAGREWYDWLPIHDLTEVQVYSTIRDAGQSPAWPYFAGMTRYSCCFCIMASEADLKTAATLNPSLYREVVRLERKVGHTLSMTRRPLEQITRIAA
ncbi:phosphoadenosine phosphosulfate reductase [Roseibium sp. TrichSKD4]|uniref:phosphoadenosine phosphosulfate reductase domain-containing protein n=1 Tax=Roseibium sp. TrichSKD4 TaxID=744980 RepID=UPI0001E56AFF|nr:phosphoadenosine phosphosulfate reductase family protein [Roseibium sp. TrichSKD4]EFO32589.1 phosphoadenosine phosphosulfate reductase [Roseibium sp. TrichSKD4]